MKKTSVQITAKDFDHIVNLARLTITPKDRSIAGQLAQAVQYVEVLDELDTSAVKPTFQVNHKKNIFRDDVVEISLSQDMALSQAPKKHNGYFVTAATIKK